MVRNALWVLVGLSLVWTLGCGNSRLTSVNLSPAVADAQNFPNGQAQFSAMGTYGGSSKKVPLTNITWCVGSANGVCNGNVASAASVDASGVAHCNNFATGTVTILAGAGGAVNMPDEGQQLKIFGTAQLTCP